MRTIDSDAQILGEGVTWNTRPSVINGFWITTPERVGSNLTGGTRTLVTDDFGNLVRTDFGILARTLKN